MSYYIVMIPDSWQVANKVFVLSEGAFGHYDPTGLVRISLHCTTALHYIKSCDCTALHCIKSCDCTALHCTVTAGLPRVVRV